MRTPLRHVRSLFLKKRPIHLTFFVTGRCNARCPFCFYEKAPRAEGRGTELSLDEIRRVSRSLGSLLWVLFSGGEPFLREDIVEVSGTFHDQNDAGFLTYPTNGFLPEMIAGRVSEVLERCKESVVVVKLSLDGVGADHDRLREVPGGFEKVIRTCELLAALAERSPRLELGVNTLFCEENQQRMDGVIDLVRGLPGVRSHTITMYRPAPGKGLGVDLDLYERAIRRLEERWTIGPRKFHRFLGGRLKAAQDHLQRTLIHRTLVEDRRLVPCYAGRLNLVLTETGELHPCEGRWDQSFGNVRAAGYDVGEMLRSPRARKVLEEIAAPEACHCSHECNFLTNILFNPLMQPRLLGEYARRLARERRSGADEYEGRLNEHTGGRDGADARYLRSH